MRWSEATVGRALLHIEERTGLLRRCQPLDIRRVEAELVQSWKARDLKPPVLEYAAPVNLALEQRQLEDVVNWCRMEGSEAQWFAERAVELSLEIELGDCVGQPEFLELAARRFPSPTPSEALELDPLLRSWLAKAPPSERCPPTEANPSDRVRSDDVQHPSSLLRAVERRIGELRLAARVEVASDLLALAAVGRDRVFISREVWLRPSDAERTALHEVYGHLRPRLNEAGEAQPILRCGCAGSGEDEEGHALYLEEQAGMMDAGRQRELAIRHHAALLVREGASFAETMGFLVGEGGGVQESVRAWLRAGRGGGLCRELVYLPRWRKVRKRLTETPALSRWFERGRVSLDFAEAHPSAKLP